MPVIFPKKILKSKPVGTYMIILQVLFGFLLDFFFFFTFIYSFLLYYCFFFFFRQY